MAAEDPVPESQCRPCRGSGTVISRLGGEERTVTCPWCAGTGEYEPGSDAQQRGAELRGAG